MRRLPVLARLIVLPSAFWSFVVELARLIALPSVFRSFDVGLSRLIALLIVFWSFVLRFLITVISCICQNEPHVKIQ